MTSAPNRSTSAEFVRLVQDNESIQAKEKTKRYCCGRMSGKTFVVFVVTAVLVSIAIAIPITYLIAKSVISNAQVTPIDITMTASGYETAEGKEYLQLDLLASVTNGAMLGGVLLSTDMDVYAVVKGKEIKVVSMKIPDTIVQAKVEEKIVRICDSKSSLDTGLCRLEKLSLEELDSLHDLVQSVLVEEEIEMKMVAPYGVQLKSMGIQLPFTFEFAKTFKAPGMNRTMSKVSIEEFDLTDSDETGLKFKATAMINNPSIFGFTLLPSKMEIYTNRNDSIPKQSICDEEIFIGTSLSLGSVTLEPGQTANVTMEGQLTHDIKTECIENFVQRYLTGDGNQVIAKLSSNATESQILNTMLESTVLYAYMAKGYDGDLFQNTVQNSMIFAVTENDNEFTISTNMDVEINSPVGKSKMEAISMDQMNVVMKYQDQAMGELIGQGKIRPNGNNSLHVEIQADGILNVGSDQEDGFATFMSTLMMEDTALDVVLDGYVSAKVNTALGLLDLKQLRLNSAIQISGLGGLKENKIAKLDLTQSTRDKIIMDVEFDAFNPTKNTLRTGPLKFDIVYQDTIIGYLKGREDTTLANGWNTLPMVGTMSPEFIKTEQDREHLSQVLSNYLTGKNTTIVATPSKIATDNVLLNKGLAGVQMQTMMEPIQDQLIQGLAFSTLHMYEPRTESIQLTSTSRIETFECLGPNGKYVVESIAMDIEMKSEQGEALGSMSVSDAIPTQAESPNLDVPITGTLELKHGGMKMAEWMKQFIASPSINLRIEGTTDVSAILPGFTFPVLMRGIQVSNTVELAGMDKTNGVFPIGVDGFDLPSNSPNGIALSINSSFSNPSIAKISMGTLDGKLMYNDAEIGAIQVPDFEILPGYNQFAAQGEIKSISQDGFEALQHFFNAYLAHKPSTCRIEGSIQGAEWLSSVLQSTEMLSTIAGMDSTLQVVQSMTFNEDHDLNVWMKNNEQPRFQGQLISSMKIPFDFPVQLVSYDGSVQASSAYGPFGQLMLTKTQCSGQCSTKETIILDMEATLDTTATENGFQDFIKQVVSGSQDSAVRMDITGELACTISTNLDYNGQSLYVSAPIDTSTIDGGLRMPALNNMGPITIDSLQVTNGASTTLPMTTKSQMCNPSSFVNMYTSSLALDVYFKGAPVARVSSGGDMVLKKNSCTALTLSGAIDRSIPGFDDVLANEMFGNYINNRPSSVSVRGVRSSYMLQNALSELSLQTTVPALQCTLDNTSGCPIVQYVDVKDIGFNNFGQILTRMFTPKKFNLVKTVEIKMFIKNPFPNTILRPTRYDIKIDYDGQNLAYIDSGPTDLEIPGGETRAIPLSCKGVNADHNTFKRQMKMSCDLFHDRLYVDTGAGTSLSALIGDYEINVGYRQERVKISCNMNSHLQKLCDATVKNTFLYTALANSGCRMSKRQRRLRLQEILQRGRN